MEDQNHDINESQDNSLDLSIAAIRKKIILIGDCGVGKTALISRWYNNNFSGEYEASIGIDFCSKTIYANRVPIKLQIWDSAGQERYRSMIPSYIRNSDVIFIVYDISLKSSFDSVSTWIKFTEDIDNNALKVLVGNKIDLESERAVSFSEGQELAKSYGIEFCEVSAKDNTYNTNVGISDNDNPNKIEALFNYYIKSLKDIKSLFNKNMESLQVNVSILDKDANLYFKNPNTKKDNTVNENNNESSENHIELNQADKQYSLKNKKNCSC